MIVLAIAFYILMNQVPKWILKEKYSQMGKNFNWSVPFIKLAGFAFCFLLTFILTFAITKSTKYTYIENKNAIHGLKFNNTMKEFGFQDGMKIKSVNGQDIEKVSDITKRIIYENSEIEVLVEKNGIEDKIALGDPDKIKLMQNHLSDPIVPIMFDANGKNEIIKTEKSFGLYDVIVLFYNLWKYPYSIINSNPSAYESIGGYVTISNINDVTIRGYFMIFAMNLIIIGNLNLLPLPGFSLGNFIISTVETLRKKLYNKRKKRIISWISIFLVIVLLILSLA